MWFSSADVRALPEYIKEARARMMRRAIGTGSQKRSPANLARCHSMTMLFDQDDIKHCFGVDCDNPPAYRVITLTEEGIVEGESVGGIGISLLCKECLTREHNLSDLGQPVLYGDRKVPGPVDIAIFVLPLQLTKSQVGQIREEITEQVPVKKPA